MDLNFPVFATGVRIFRASNDVGPLFLGPGSTRILEIYPRGKHGEIKVHWSSACGYFYTRQWVTSIFHIFIAYISRQNQRTQY
jgi:hypothetical protein